MLEKTKKIGMLFDFYGKLLTQRQQNIIKLYYYQDLSLGEIADKEDVSRQAVYDHLQRGEKLLIAYEKKLKYIKLFTNTKNKIENIIDNIQKSKGINNKTKNELVIKLNELKENL